MDRRRLPLFPLPVVLFPAARMPLHIFEPRYREMIARCLEHDRTFGLLFHDWDESGPFLNEPGRVGTVARIEDHRPLPDGRSMILVRGCERFRINDGLESDTPYFEALVEDFPDRKPADPGQLVARRRESLELFRAVVDALREDGEEMPSLDVDDELSFRLARTVEIEPAWQHSLLKLREEARRLERLDAIFQVALDRAAS